MNGTFANLARSEMAEWEGYAIYCWEHGVIVGLFDEKPEADELGWDWTDAIEGVDPNLLAACGIKPEGWDKNDSAFYYGEECIGGQHPPIKIKLTLPLALLEQLGLA